MAGWTHGRRLTPPWEQVNRRRSRPEGQRGQNRSTDNRALAKGSGAARSPGPAGIAGEVPEPPDRSGSVQALAQARSSE